MVTKRRESWNPPQKQQLGSLETRRTIQFCQVHSLASFRGECACCVSMPLLLSILLSAEIFVVGWFLLWVKRRPTFWWILTVEAFVLVISISCCVFVVSSHEAYIKPVPHAVLRNSVWLSVHRASCFAVALVGPFLWGCSLLALALGRASLNPVLPTTLSLSVAIIEDIGRFIRCGVAVPAEDVAENSVTVLCCA